MSSSENRRVNMTIHFPFMIVRFAPAGSFAPWRITARRCRCPRSPARQTPGADQVVRAARFNLAAVVVVDVGGCVEREVAVNAEFDFIGDPPGRGKLSEGRTRAYDGPVPILGPSYPAVWQS